MPTSTVPLNHRKTWLLKKLAEVPRGTYVDLTSSVAVEHSLELMAQFADEVLGESNADLTRTQRAFGRVLKQLFDDGYLDRDKVRNEEVKKSGQPTWCYVYRITAKGRRAAVDAR